MRKATQRHSAPWFGLLALALAVLLPAPDAFAQVDPGTFTINHFNIYQNFNETASGFLVGLRDQFGERDHTLGRIEWYGVPVDKNFEGVPDPTAHLTWWRLTDNIEEPIRRVVVQNQFGDQTLDVFGSDFMLAPALKNPDGTRPLPDSHDHYKCYRVEGDDVFVGLELFDQFSQNITADIRPIYLCNPAEKTIPGAAPYPITKPDEHLVCYLLLQSSSADVVVVAQDQFGTWSLALTEHEFLCVPSLKDQIVQTFEETWGGVKSIYR